MSLLDYSAGFLLDWAPNITEFVTVSPRLANIPPPSCPIPKSLVKKSPSQAKENVQRQSLDAQGRDRRSYPSSKKGVGGATARRCTNSNPSTVQQTVWQAATRFLAAIANVFQATGHLPKKTSWYLDSTIDSSLRNLIPKAK